MNNISYRIKIKGLTLKIFIEDFGDRLSEYKPCWKWTMLMINSETKYLKTSLGPKNGYYSQRFEAINDAIEHLPSLSELIKIDNDLQEMILEEILEK